ncbi:MAG TPA: hypothetical protein PK609_02750 [Candidatus Paceibacterota bacterium]|nr:hypothetical protein [Candidatus Paceibacterota bacterium]
MSEHKRKVRKLWFRAKEYGWGWYPVSWQGWLITVLYALLFTITFLLFFGWIGAAREAETRDLIFGILEFLAVITLLSYSLYRICSKFGEKPEWRWGKK